MTLSSTEFSAYRPLHVFDGALGDLYDQLLDMTGLLLHQLEQLIHALDYADVELALRVSARDRKVDDCHTRIQHQIDILISAAQASSNELRTVTMVGKINDTLESLGNKFADIAKLTPFVLNDAPPNDTTLIADILPIASLLKAMLDKMMIVFETRNSNQAYKLMNHGWHCDTQLQQSFERPLAVAMQHAASLDYSLIILQILKALESCAGLCRHIGEYQILMLDSIDIRRASPSALLSPHRPTPAHAPSLPC